MGKARKVVMELLKLDFKAAKKTLLCKCQCWRNLSAGAEGKEGR